MSNDQDATTDVQGAGSLDFTCFHLPKLGLDATFTQVGTVFTKLVNDAVVY